MILWIALCTIVVLLIIALLMPVRLHLSMHGRGDPSGAWAIAGGTRLGPLTATAVGSHAVPFVVQIDLFRWKLWRRDLSEPAPPKPDEPTVTLAERYHQLERWVEPDEVALFLTGEHRRVRLEELEIDLQYSFADVALTGTMFGGIAVLDAMLPPRIRVRQTPSWDAVDRAGASMSGKIKVWPGLLLIDGVRFAARNLKLRRHHGNRREAEQNRR